MSDLRTIIQRASTEVKFYEALATNFSKTIAPYRLSKTEVTKLKQQLRNVRPPDGTKTTIIGENG